ncbi:MAG: hypothetical protein M3R38_34815 [Actinomycetota bacterium]|nr:hypothetical protein [Actinomycetota bacterium]
MKRHAIALAASFVLLALAGCALVGGHSEASCAAPMIEVEPHRAAPGEAFRVHGEAFGRGCDDVGPGLDPSKPLQNIRLAFRQGSREWTLATVDADRQLSFDARLRVPEEAGPGRAVVRAAWPTKDRFLMPQDRVRVLGK